MTTRSDKRRLASNTAFLYGLVFSSQLLNFAVIPYETRVLGPSWFGTVGMIVSLMGFVTIVLDFGFLLSATAEVSSKRADSSELSIILASVTGSKLLLALVLFVSLAVISLAVPVLRDHVGLVAAYALAYAIGSLLPDYVYRGLEDMRAITLRTITVRFFCTVLTFVLLRGPEDVYILPFLLFFGNTVATCYSFHDLKRRYGVSLVAPRLHGVLLRLKASLPFFASRFASTAYQSLNAVLLGVVYPGSSVVGLFSSADKFLSLAKTASSPIADSLFPYMTKSGNFQLCKRLLLATIPLLVILGGFLFVFSGELCAFVFGKEFYGAGELLKCLLPAIIVILPTYIICFPMLVPMGLSKQANFSTFIGAGVQVAAIFVLFAFGTFTPKNLCLAASLSEVSVFVYRLGVMLLHWDKAVAVKEKDDDSKETVCEL